MSTDRRIEGYAVISQDGMLADALGEVPDTLLLSADREFMQQRLAAADVVIHGRSLSRYLPTLGRCKRVIVTRQVKSLEPDPCSSALFWNPEGASFDEAIAVSAGPSAVVAVLGATHVYDRFLDLYEVFYLSCSLTCWLPEGRPVFSGVPERSPEEILVDHGMTRYPHRTGYASVSETLSCWRR
jgi:hypothetical protein